MNFFKEEGYTPSKKIGFMDKKQLVALLLALLFALLLRAVFEQLDASGSLRLLRLLSLFNLFLLFARIGNYMFILKNFKADYALPLHFCSFNVIWCALAMSTKSAVLLDFVYTMSPLPALFALLSPESEAGKYPHFGSFRCWEYYTSHTLLVCLPLFAERYTAFSPSFEYAAGCALVFLVMALTAWLANKYTGGNYMFLAHAPHGTPLTIVEDKLKKTGYRILLISFFGVLYVAIHLMYGAF